MKKLLIFLSVFLLISCENNIQAASEISYSLEPLEVTVTPVKSEVSSDLHYIHDPLMPNYVTLKSYPNEWIIDWETETHMHYEAGKQLVFNFKEEEKLKTIELESHNLKYLKLIHDNYEKIVKIEEGFTSIEVDELYTDRIVLEILETASDVCEISEIHMISYEEVSEVAYNHFLTLQSEIEYLTNYFDWKNDVGSNLKIVGQVIDTYSCEELEMLSKPIDLNYLNKGPTIKNGIPVKISGRVLTIDENKITLNTHVYHEVVTIHTDRIVDLGENITICGLLIGKDQNLVFYDIQ